MAYNILIVEDDQRIASVVRFHLERESYTCHHAADGDSGLAMALELQPDLVVLDVMLPGKSGFDVCRGIRNAKVSQPAILMLTARVEEVDAVMGLTFGADDYVRKPFGVKEFVARVRSLLQRREVGAQLWRENTLIAREGATPSVELLQALEDARVGQRRQRRDLSVAANV